MNTITFTGKRNCVRLEEIAHEHGEPAVAGEGDDLPAGERALRADRLRHRVGHRAMPEGPEQPPLAVHRQIACGPHRRLADVASENGVFGGVVAHGLDNLLRVDRPPAGLADRQLIEALSRLAIMTPRPVKVRRSDLLLEPRQ